MYGFLLRRTREDDAALELTSETFARARLSRERFVDRADGSAAPWLLWIAGNVLADSVRKQRLEREARERLSVD